MRRSRANDWSTRLAALVEAAVNDSRGDTAAVRQLAAEILD